MVENVGGAQYGFSLFYDGGSSNKFLIQSGTGSPASFVTRVAINRTTGDVGIGTATPAEKLDVVGNIEASGDDGNNGIVLTSPDGNRKLITVANDGTLVVVAA